MLSQHASRYLGHIGRVRHSLLNAQNKARTQILPLNLHQQRRHLDLQEYQSKKLLHEHGVKVQRFKVVSTGDEAHRALFPEEYPQSTTSEPINRWAGFDTDLSTAAEFVIKAQVLAGGRGKGHFNKSSLSGVMLTQSRKTALTCANEMLNDHLVTHQTTSDGVLVEKVMIAEAVRLKEEYYFAILLDRSYEKGLLLVACPEGGMDIEEIAKKTPHAIRRFTIPLGTEFDFETARRTAMMAFELNVQQQEIVDQCAREMMNLHSMFIKLDATQIEINPIGVTKANEVICVDAKIKFDENARFRHRWLDEVEVMNRTETDRRDFEARKHNLNFIGLNGSIGCLVNGAGLAMATMDIIKLHGGEPANFLDVGGGASTEQVFEAFRIITSDSSVRAIFVNIFGGIMRCDTIAHGILQAAQKLNLKLPIVCRLQGTRVEDAQELIRRNKEQAGLNLFVVDDLDEAAKLAVKLIDSDSSMK